MYWSTGAALAFAERGKPEVLHRPLNSDINSSISEKQDTEMDAGRFSNNYTWDAVTSVNLNILTVRY